MPSSPSVTEVPKRLSKAKPSLPKQELESGITVISAQGEVVLAIEHCHGPASTGTKLVDNDTLPECLYRVDGSLLATVSPYFSRLLDSGKFGEGARVADRTKALKEQYGSIGATPIEKLPRITIKDIGRISDVKSIYPLMADFFSMLHGGDLSAVPPPLANIANLVVVADRFDAISAMRKYFETRKLLKLLDGLRPAKSSTAFAEERLRQRLLVGLMLDNPAWVLQSSRRLIQFGFVGHDHADNAPLWWDLPMRVEEELAIRREYILETIQSVQTHFLGLYLSRERQCKLGYDSSAQCDSYQLGQMARFFTTKTRTLSLTGTLLLPCEGDLPEQAYNGDLTDLIESLRECPEYQIDKNHSHCGLRIRLMPILDLIGYSIVDAGICLQCWQSCRAEYAWGEAKRALVWKVDSPGFGTHAHAHSQTKKGQTRNHAFEHVGIRDFFMAKEHLWTVRSEVETGKRLGSAFGTTGPLNI